MEVMPHSLAICSLFLLLSLLEGPIRTLFTPLRNIEHPHRPSYLFTIFQVFIYELDHNKKCKPRASKTPSVLSKYISNFVESQCDPWENSRRRKNQPLPSPFHQTCFQVKVPDKECLSRIKISFMTCRGSNIFINHIEKTRKSRLHRSRRFWLHAARKYLCHSIHICICASKSNDYLQNFFDFLRLRTRNSLILMRSIYLS